MSGEKLENSQQVLNKVYKSSCRQMRTNYNVSFHQSILLNPFYDNPKYVRNSTTISNYLDSLSAQKGSPPMPTEEYKAFLYQKVVGLKKDDLKKG